MSKSRLQELCHQRLWPPPDYTVSHDGPAHYPRFRAIVTVNGVNFHSPGVFKSSKGAQNMAAQVAIDHFAANPPLKPSPQTPVLVESQIPFKTQLLIYAQKNNVGLPKYDAVVHAPCFKANVTVNGQTFYSQQFFNTLKVAEDDAAKVALSSLSPGESQNPQNDSTFFKNLLQELATKDGMSLPKYTTVSTGACHMPIFCSTVEIGGESFVGDAAKTKKQAEMNAANVAWFKLKERLNTNSGRGSLSSGCLMHESLKPASSGSHSKDIRNLELPKSSSISPSHIKLNHSKENPEQDLRSEYQGPHQTKETMGNVNLHTENMAANSKLDAEVPMNIEVPVEDSISQDWTSIPSVTSDCTVHPVADVISVSPEERACSSLLCNRVRVYPCKPDMVLPKGAISLPFSDDMWVTVSLDFSNHEDICDEEGITAENDSNTVSMAPILHDDQGTHSKEIMLNGNCHIDKSDLSLHKEIEVITDILSEEETSSSMESACNDLGVVADVNSEMPMGVGTCSMQHNGGWVHPNKPHVVIPGASWLLSSDDKRVALSMDF